MKKSLFLILLIFVISNFSFLAGQNDNVLNTKLIEAINLLDEEKVLQYCEEGASLTQCNKAQKDLINNENAGSLQHSLFQKGKYKATIVLSEYLIRRMALRKDNWESHFEYLAESCAGTNNFKPLMDYLDEMETFCDQQNDISSKIDVISIKINLLNYIGDIDDIEFLYINKAECYKKTNDTLQYLCTLNNLGLYYLQQKPDYNKSDSLFSTVLAKFDKYSLNDKPDYFTVRYNMVLLLSAEGKYSECIPFIEETIRRAEETFGKNSIYEAQALYQLANVYNGTGFFRKAINLYNEVAEIYGNNGGLVNQPGAELLQNAGCAYQACGEYDNAITCLEAANNIFEQIVAPAFSQAGCKESLSELYTTVGRYSEAEDVLSKTFDILEPYGESNECYQRALNGLGLLYYYQGKYDEAEKVYTKLISICGSNLAPIPLSTLQQNIGLLYAKVCKFELAEDYLLQSLKTIKNEIGEANPLYARVANSLALFWEATGKDLEAFDLLLNNKEIYERFGMTSCFEYALCLNNLSVIANKHKHFEFGLNCMKKSIDYIEQMDKGDMDKGWMYCNLGLSYTGLIEFDSAQLCYEKALDYYEKDRPTDPNVINLYYNLGKNHYLQKQFIKADSIYQKGIDFVDSNHYESYDSYYKLLNEYAFSRMLLGDYESARTCFQKDFELRKKSVIDNFAFMSEQQRDTYWETLNDAFICAYPALIYSDTYSQDHSAAFAYDNELFYKGILLDATQQMQNTILCSNDTALSNRFREWQTLREEIVQKQTTQNFNPDLDSIVMMKKKEAEDIEKELMKGSKEFRQNSLLATCTWKDVAATLKSDEVAIEFSTARVFDGHNFNDTIRYYALLLKKDKPFPIFVPLADGHFLNNLLQQKPDVIYSSTLYGNALYEKIWKPISAYLTHEKTIYFAVSEALHQFNLGAIVNPDGKHLYEEYNMIQLSSSRELLKERTPNDGRSAVLYGGLKYDIDVDEMYFESSKYNQIDLLATRSVNDTTSREGFSFLPGTLIEIASINDLLKQHEYITSLYSGTNGNEESFKSLSGKKSTIIHIASHGFFWTNKDAINKEWFKRHYIDSKQEATDIDIDPLLRSGLLLSGSNLAYTGHSLELPDGIQDGILTAKEISLLDLRGTDLVVLSACETGLGDITSEGVFGLQRAFKIAGVQTIVMSLWKVDDNATCLMMQTFYEQLLSGMSKREAFNLAQATVRAKYPEPYYWAGFVMLD